MPDRVLGRALDTGQRFTMRADLVVIPLRASVCYPLHEAFIANLFASIPKPEENRLQRQAARAETVDG
jgi:hypothetical protein